MANFETKNINKKSRLLCKRKLNFIISVLITNNQNCSKFYRLWYETIVEWVSIGSHVTVVHYEDLKTDRATEIERLLRFFNIPIDPIRIDCLKSTGYDNIKRKASGFQVTRAMFDTETNDLVDSYIGKMNQVLRKYKQNELPLQKYDL